MPELQKILEAINKNVPDARILSFGLDGSEEIPSGDGETPSNKRRHKLLITGSWKGHWMGAFTVTKDDLTRVVNNAKSQGVDTLVDYEHASVFSLFAPAGSTKASGWLDPQSLEVREEDSGHALFGVIDWTPNAARAIRNKEFRYLSPTIRWRTPDRKTNVDMGTSLHSVALTNTPFLEELPEVHLNSLRAKITGLSVGGENENMDPKKQAALALALGLSADASPEDMIAAAKEAQKDAKALEGVCLAAGLESGSTGGEIVNAVTTLKAQSLPADEVKSLRAQAAEGRKVQISSAVERATQEGKIVASNKDWATRLAEKDFAAFSDWAKSAPSIVPTDIKTPKGDSKSLSDIDPQNPSKDDVKRLVSAMSDEDRKLARDAGVTDEVYAEANAIYLMK